MKSLNNIFFTVALLLIPCATTKIFPMEEQVELMDQAHKIAILAAANLGDASRLQELIDADAVVVNQHNTSLMTPLHYAAKNGHLSVVKILIKNGADINRLTAHGRTPLAFALESNNPEVVRFLIEAGADIRLGCRLISANTDIENVKLLLSMGGNIDHIFPSYSAFLNVKLLELFINAGVDIKRTDDNGNALHFVVRPDVAQFLIEHGLDVNQKNSKGQTPLHVAKTAAVAKVLLDNKAQVDEEDYEGLTPLCSRIRSKAFVSKNIVANRTAIAKLLIARGANVDYTDYLGETPLFRAIRFGSIELAGAFIRAGADIYHKDKQGLTPIAMNNQIMQWRYEDFNALFIEQARKNKYAIIAELLALGGTHARVGKDSPLMCVSQDILQYISQLAVQAEVESGTLLATPFAMPAKRVIAHNSKGERPLKKKKTE